jgi:CRP-like cAMP-binding protein/serine/threonine protein phosphatase PrpC
MDLVTTTAFSPGASVESVYLDQVQVEPRLGLLAVADAPSGGDDGRAGIRIALDAVRRHVERNQDILDRFRSHPAPELRTRILAVIDEAFGRAAQEVFAYARRRRGLLVTLDVVLMLDHEAFVGHVGDGRVYLIRRGLVHQLTVDHSRGDETAVVFEGGDAEPKPDDETTASAGGRNFTRALGALPGVKVESLCMELVSDDRFVVTTSHLHRQMPDGTLHPILIGEPMDALGPALSRAADKRPVVAAAGQVGSGEPFKADSARARLAILAPMPMFMHCTERELRVVAAATRPRRFESETVLFREGDPGEELFLVISGKVRIERQGQVLVILGPGSNFGEMAILDERSRSATAVAAEDCEVLVIHRDAFFTLLKGNPTLAMKILWNMLLRLSARLRTTSGKLAEATQIPPYTGTPGPPPARMNPGEFVADATDEPPRRRD